MKWLNPPPLAVISGKQDYLRRQEVKKALGVAKKSMRVFEFSGADKESWEDAIETPSMFDVTKTFVLITDAEKISDVKVLLSHLENESDISVALSFNGDVPSKSPFKELLEKLDKDNLVRFDLPKSWDAKDEAKKFVMKEANRRGHSIESSLANLLVNSVGTDYGVLSFEILKASALSERLHPDDKKISRGELGATVALVFEMDGFPVTRSLMSKDLGSLARNLGSVERGSFKDPTMSLCGLLTTHILTWLKATWMASSGYSLEEAAGRVGKHPFPYEKDTFPVTKNWKTNQLVDLLRGIGSVERNVKLGCVSPWTQLTSLLYQTCMK